jgi:hypothetical protein
VKTIKKKMCTEEKGNDQKMCKEKMARLRRMGWNGDSSCVWAEVARGIR